MNPAFLTQLTQVKVNLLNCIKQSPNLLPCFSNQKSKAGKTVGA